MVVLAVVNRIWQQYFGKGIVGTPSDFGAMGEKPTHPELLDHLAIEFVERGWNLKAIHRMIVTSAAYQQASDPQDNPAAALATKLDPANRLLWHQRVRRRDAESIRDNALQASGALSTRMFGVSALPELPKAVMESRYAWNPDDRLADRNRRSVYVFHRRNLTLPLFQAFDAPDRVDSCPSRVATTTAPQALVLLNGEFMNDQANRMATDLMKSSSDVVAEAYRRILGREPTVEDATAARLFLDRQTRTIAAVNPDPALAATADLCQALLNSAEFLYVD